MPTIEVEKLDLEELLGFRLQNNQEELDSMLASVKGEVKYFDQNQLHIEIKDSNRADLWSAEGIARALKGLLSLETGLQDFQIHGRSRVEVTVDANLESIRPYMACAVLKNIQLSNTAIRQIMHLQDKIDQTYGRQRRRTSIGLYDFDLITPPLRYTIAKPDEVSFIPLEFDQKINLREILDTHPKGMEYGHLIRHFDVWPIFVDSDENVLSFPPIINSNSLGRITEETRNLFIEVTGTLYRTTLNTLTTVTTALAERGGQIYSVDIKYPYEEISQARTPDLSFQTMNLDSKYVHRILGRKLGASEIRNLLERSRYGVSDISETEFCVEVPCYRIDVMHPIDVIEDIAIAYDYNLMHSQWPQMSTIGELSLWTKYADLIRETMIGLGYQEILTYSLNNSESLFDEMNIQHQKVIELANPKVESYTCLRNWLLPSAMEFLSHNVHVEYPQRIFEVGYCVLHSPTRENEARDVEKLIGVTIHSGANFTEVKSTLESLFLNLGIRYNLEETSHGSFIEGRVGRILVDGEDIGLVGEIHPQVLQNWNLENPAASFEIDIESLRDHID